MPYTYNPFSESLDYYKTPPVLSGTISDHGQLTGLSDDDHPQYHCDTRGDARYYTKTILDNGQLDSRYYTELEVDTISGSLQTNIDGKADTIHTHTEGDITNLDKYTQAEVDSLITTVSGKLDDHNELNNLDYASSGHTGFQPAGDYATDVELITVSGDLQTNIDGKSGSGHTHDDRYYTEAEVDALTWTESDITDLDKYTQAEVDTISGSLNNKINIYETIYIDAAAMIPCTTGGALQGTNEYGTHDVDIDYFAFDGGATEERVQFKLKMPENWNLGTIKVKFDWSSATGSTAGDTVELAIKAAALTDSDVIDVALGTPQVISDILLAGDGTNLQTTSATPALTVGGTPAKNDLLIFEVYRNTDGTDDCAEDLWLFGCTIQYKKSGSTTSW